jgi:hypothetical protein
MGVSSLLLAEIDLSGHCPVKKPFRTALKVKRMVDRDDSQWCWPGADIGEPAGPACHVIRGVPPSGVK